MFKLTNRLALTNLIKNRQLYYPFALAVVLAVTVTYLFYSLTFNPELQNLRGYSSISFTLELGLLVVTIAAAIIIFYANSFVMKNRSKELGVYGMLGLEKRHLMSMMFKELFVFGLLTVGLGIGVGLVFDKLIFALLLKLMKMPVVLTSHFQPELVILLYVIFGLIFAGLVLSNSWRILRMNALQLSRETRKGEKRSRFLLVQTLLGVISLGCGYYLAQIVTNPMSAIIIFFLAVLLVILGTYLLFNAGTTVFLQLLKKNKSYYYQPNNMISVSNLIFRMKKNAVGLATISILSTMVLVTLSAATNAYLGGEHFKKVMNPHDFSLQGSQVSEADLDDVLTGFVKDNHLEVTSRDLVSFATFGLAHQEGARATLYTKEERNVQPKTIFIVFSQADYQELTGQFLNLTGNQVALFAKNKDLQNQKSLTLNGIPFDITYHVKEDFMFGHVPNQYNLLTSDYNYLVVPDLQAFIDCFPDSNIWPELYGGLSIKASDNQKEQLASVYEDYVNQANQELGQESYFYANSRFESEAELDSLLGGILFIGIFLSVVFMAGTVLVIYYKQISEGYEDRERFVILQKLGLDDRQIKQTINKQVLTVFFLPLIFAFVNLAFAYHMLRLILQVLGVLNNSLMLIVTLSICGLFFLTYVAVFKITSRSYRKIVQL